MRVRFLVLSFFAFVLLGAGAARIVVLERGSLSVQAGRPLPIGRTELVQAVRSRGAEVVVEICSPALSPATPLEGVRFSIVDRTSRRVVLATTIDPRTIRTGRRYSCSVLARAAAGRGGSDLAVVATSDRVIDAVVAGRIVTRLPLTPVDFLLVAALACVTIALLVVAARAKAPSPADEIPAARTLALALGVFGVAYGLTFLIPIAGAIGGCARASILLAAQLGVVAWALGALRPESLGFLRPQKLALYVALAPVFAIAIAAFARILARALPATKPSGISRLAVPSAGLEHAETILDPRSGILAIAIVAIVAPVAEELFYRGVVYGSVARRTNTTAAFAITATLFVLAHVPQTAGDPAALISIGVLSLVATGLRARTGSVVPSAAMHFAHNAMLALVGLLASR